MIDNPDDALDTNDVRVGAAVARNSVTGVNMGLNSFNADALTFTISTVLPDQTIRVGLLVNSEGTNDGRWDATSITITNTIDATDTVTFGNALTNPLAVTDDTNDGAGWLLVDITEAGTYTIGGTQRSSGNQALSFGGFTFDSVTIPEPSSVALLGFGALGFLVRRRR